MNKRYRRGRFIISDQLNLYHIYANLVQEFELHLKRELNEQEKNFLKWLSQKIMDDTPSAD